MSAVAQRNFFNRACGNLRKERSHAFRQHDVGLHLGILFGGNRRDVYRILNDAVLQIFPHLLGNLHSHGFLRFVCGTADVRSENDVVHGLERRVLQRLFVENIQRCSRNLALLQRLH